MTDLPADDFSIPARLGVGARVHNGEFQLTLEPFPALLHHDVLRISAMTFLVDVIAGVVMDSDPDRWLLTTDLTVRSLAGVAAPGLIATTQVLRQGRRSSTCHVEVVAADGSTQAVGAVAFAQVPLRPNDPPKHILPLDEVAELFDTSLRIDGPLRDVAGIEVLDAAAGVVQIDVTSAVRNPAGTMQGAMVALVVEAAVEEMVEKSLGGPVAVVDLDLRYLATTSDGPVRSSCRWLGPSEQGSVEVRLTDLSTGALTTLAYARAVDVAGPAPGG
ncbi:MAG: hypothetical protein IT195_01840 [Microthrixaceae bacterium]|nr:hypothetical protein [Microthrixaceae bacterium]